MKPLREGQEQATEATIASTKITHTPQFYAADPTPEEPAMLVTQALSKQDLPAYSNKSTLSRANPHLITQVAPSD